MLLEFFFPAKKKKKKTTSMEFVDHILHKDIGIALKN